MTAEGETGSVDDRDTAKLRTPPHRKIPLNHREQNSGAFRRAAVIKPKYLQIRANRRRFLG
ncbi:hypothetical protein [Bradyrhizobium sp. CB1015]|uniref:hypothetical protein n=1 Tax=Bradyrhizobium sp. CB1015 TaxID=2976822 RepID=UPI0021A97BA5|nr:hypothetical protein [Bradyrhizobium sp. CB1015]UWU92453.1 hypothetical protein N2604_00300 [Bradyrhizobium sp. CB1015]